MSRRDFIKSFLAVVLVALDLASVAGTPRNCVRVRLAEKLSADYDNTFRSRQAIDAVDWIGASDASAAFYRFRRDFAVATATVVRVHVSADERFVLLCDGRELARGPHRGQVRRWFYQTYDLALDAGDHRLEAVVFNLKGAAPIAQESYRGGSLILAAEGDFAPVLSTGAAEWKVAPLSGTRSQNWLGDSGQFCIGHQMEVIGTGLVAELPPDSAYRPAVTVRLAPLKGCWNAQPGWRLHPSPLPEMLWVRRTPGRIVAARTDSVTNCYAAADASSPWAKAFGELLAHGAPVTIPAGQGVRILWDLGDYYGAYPRVTTRGGKGGVIRWNWNESLFDANGRKGDRNGFVGKRLGRTMADIFRPDGRADGDFTTPWWRCGRWCEVEFGAEEEPLVITSLALDETRYPLEETGSFECEAPGISQVFRLCARGLEECLHETYFDCPYYEQQQYPGDGRTEILTTAALSPDSAAPRNLVSAFDWARRENGIVPMVAPGNHTESATYSLCWAVALADCAEHYDCADFVRARLPGVRIMLEGVARFRGGNGLLTALPGWSFMDWAAKFTYGRGMPKDGETGCNAENNLLWVYALRRVAAAERAVGEAEQAAIHEKLSAEVAAKARAVFYDENRHLFASDSGHATYSEHAQCLALLADFLPAGEAKACYRALVTADDLARCTVYFSHYLFETFFKFGEPDRFLSRLDLWRGYVASGAKTPLERPETASRDSRSDCHAWGSHPIHHLIRNVAGIRPAAPFFARVRIVPQPGSLKRIKATSPSPRGTISVDLAFDDDKVSGSVTLPEGLTGAFAWRDRTVVLASGTTEL